LQGCGARLSHSPVMPLPSGASPPVAFEPSALVNGAAPPVVAIPMPARDDVLAVSHLTLIRLPQTRPSRSLSAAVAGEHAGAAHFRRRERRRSYSA
jgi:hypothetical protein